VDIHQPEEAKGLLDIAVELSPMAPWVQFELAQALITLRQFDQANEVVDHVFTITDDRCNLGQGWRKRGFILFEQGKLEESRTAYRRSLDYDRFSQVAKSELQLLDTEIAGRGGKREPYSPPPSAQLTTQCESSAWL
jgi:tetratricopeptide (TPR) repeat protein